MRLETLLSPLSVPVVTWRWSKLSSTSMLIQIVSVYQCCYVVDGGLPQSQSTRLVTPHSLWPTKVDTGKWLSISPSLITVIQKVNPIKVCYSSMLTCIVVLLHCIEFCVVALYEFCCTIYNITGTVYMNACMHG